MTSLTQPPLTTPDYAALTINDVKLTDFIRFTNFSLKQEDEIMGFYRDVYSQGHQYGIHFKDINNINQQDGIISSTLPIDIAQMLAKTLHSKFKAQHVIATEYSTAQNLLRSTTDGYEFLLQLLLIVHPKFVNPRNIVKDIPKFLAYKDLYSYARGLQEYQNLQLINQQK